MLSLSGWRPDRLPRPPPPQTGPACSPVRGLVSIVILARGDGCPKSVDESQSRLHNSWIARRLITDRGLTPMIIRRLMLIAGIVLILPVSLLMTLVLFTPITPSGTLYLIGALLMATGAITAPWRRTRFRGVTRAGMVFVCLVAGTRLVVAARGTTVSLITLPGGQSSRWLDRLVHERDIALFGVQLGYLTGTAISPREHEGLVPALRPPMPRWTRQGKPLRHLSWKRTFVASIPGLSIRCLSNPPAAGLLALPLCSSTDLAAILRFKAGW